MGNAVSIACFIGSLIGAAVAVASLVKVTRRVRMQQLQLTTSSEWPPPYAASKGVRQDLSIAGFAFTHGNGCAFVHMRPVLHFGAGAERKALYELKRKLDLARARVGVMLQAPELSSAEANAAADQLERDEDAAMIRALRGRAELHGNPANTAEMQRTRDVVRLAAANAGVQLCDKHDPRSQLPCIEDAGHDGPCVFPEFSAAPVPGDKS